MYQLSKMPLVSESLDNFERYCAVTVALKITDDSCKMDAYEKSVFMMLYDALPKRSDDILDTVIFDIISEGRTKPSAQIYSVIKAYREEAMEVITRPRMKAFKADIRKRISA
jgi:hypothetical protein